MKEYEAIPNRTTELKIELYYDKGGMNYFTGRAQVRGYYLSVSPVERSHDGRFTTESYTAFSGVKKLILPVGRQSEKQYREALRVATEGGHIGDLKNWVLSRL